MITLIDKIAEKVYFIKGRLFELDLQLGVLNLTRRNKVVLFGACSHEVQELDVEIAKVIEKISKIKSDLWHEIDMKYFVFNEELK